ncbi:MAG TPA: nitroreductase [Caldithrix sp.]|nr:nitroreductase family protein [Bacteroidales bacterium]MBN2764663.1 nitroreductase family protein [Bacteroidales bacterium]HEM49072.1 nitroreductase [Caldithrix sp.]
MNSFPSFLDMVKTRQSTRDYDTRPVEKEKIDRCLEAARLSPSACNAQPWKFIVVEKPDIRHELADAIYDRVLSMNHFTKQAPVHIVVVRERANITSGIGQMVKGIEYPLLDIGIAAIHLCLQAVEEGLGTCIIGWFKQKKVKQLLSIPKNKRVELIITVGYPATNEIRPKKRKARKDIVSYNRY